MSVGGEVGDNLVGRDALFNGASDGDPGYLPHNHVWVANLETGEESQNRYLKRRGCVCVEAVISFYDYEALGTGFCGESGIEAS